MRLENIQGLIAADSFVDYYKALNVGQFAEKIKNQLNKHNYRVKRVSLSDEVSDYSIPMNPRQDCIVGNDGKMLIYIIDALRYFNPPDDEPDRRRIMIKFYFENKTDDADLRVLRV